MLGTIKGRLIQCSSNETRNIVQLDDKLFSLTVFQSVCDRKGNSGRNRIAIIWPEPDRHLLKLAGFAGSLTGFDIISSVVLSHTIICNFIVQFYNEHFCNRDRILCKTQKQFSKLD